MQVVARCVRSSRSTTDRRGAAAVVEVKGVEGALCLSIRARPPGCKSGFSSGICNQTLDIRRAWAGGSPDRQQAAAMK